MSDKNKNVEKPTLLDTIKYNKVAKGLEGEGDDVSKYFAAKWRHKAKKIEDAPELNN